MTSIQQKASADLNARLGIQQFTTPTELANSNTWNHYYIYLSMLANTVFEWKNLPHTMNERYLENALYSYGQAIFVYDKKFGHLSLKCIPEGPIGMYNDYDRYRAYADNGIYNKEFDADDCVFIRNNDMRIPTELSIRYYCEKICNTSRTIDINIILQRMPFILKADDDQKLAILNIFRDIMNYEPVIKTGKDFDANALDVLNLNAPYIADKLYVNQVQWWNECMTFLGINNAVLQKKERNITDEINSNNQMIILSAEMMLKERVKAANLANEKWDLNIECKLREINFREEYINDVLVSNATISNIKEGE